MEVEGGTSRLSTVDPEGRRLWIYPADVSGPYRTARNWVSGFLLILFLMLPWVRLKDHQAFLLDITHGRFTLFGIQFWSHDAPMLLFVFGGAAVLLAFVTSVWGRVWCGWTCPQTVFVDSVFRRIERWVEGDAVTRKRRDEGTLTEDKFFRKLLKWGLFIGVSLILSHSFLAYFIGTDALARMMAHSPRENLGSFVAMSLISAVVLFDFGWLREQFCTLLCPYGRFQSVLMDECSLAIAYDRARGEPRRGEAWAGKLAGDCISCNRCVHVCPTGIDIRNGLQLECVACTACADACDVVMAKVGKPPGLIRYSSGMNGQRRTYAKPIAYFTVLVILVTSLGWTVSHRQAIEMTLVRTIGAPYEEVIRPGLMKEVVNHFKLDLLNQSFDPIRVEIETQDSIVVNDVQFVSAGLPAELPPGGSLRIDLFVRFPFSKLAEGRTRANLVTRVSSPHWKTTASRTQEVPLVGPLR